MRLRIALLMLLLQTPVPQSRPLGKGVVEGTVLAAGTNEPIEDAVVILAHLARTASAAGLPDEPSHSMITDRQGRFVFKDLDAGVYRLAFESNGYVRQEYGQRVFPGSGAMLDLAKDQELRNLVVRMTRTASIRGRIVDENKQPVAGVPVELIRSGYYRNGERGLEPYGTVHTDDRGEYKLYFITPGRYYLHAGTPQPSGCCSGLRPNPNEVPAAFASMYYPGVADLQFAMPLDVKAASEIDGIDWTLRPQKLFRIRGRVIDTATGLPPSQIRLSLSTESGYSTDQFGGPVGSYENGSFEFHDVVPGLYRLSGRVSTPGASQAGALSPMVRRREAQSTGTIPIDVHSDLDGLVLMVSPGGTIAGRVRIDGADSPLAAFFKNSPPSVSLKVTQNGASPSAPGQWAVGGDLNPDGTFRVNNVLPAEYDVWIPLLDPPFYIKEARFGGTDVLNQPLQFTGQESGALDILLSSSVGALTGSVTGGQGSTAGVQVVLVPDRFRQRAELYRDVMTNQNGRFSISNIVPGDYKVFAWEAVEPYAWFDPQVLARGESRAKFVHVAESLTQTIEVRENATP